jgi:hypothetical protein
MKTMSPENGYELGSHTCLRCGRPFIPKDLSPSHLARHPPRFCSRACGRRARHARVTLTCRQCGKSFVRKRYMQAWSTERGPFCSSKCYGAWQHINLVGLNRKRVKVPCHVCGAEIEKHPSARAVHNFCSRTCFARWRSSEEWSGSNNPAWLGGHAAYRGPNWMRQSASARRRDKDTCQRCSYQARNLSVHHITPFRLFKDYREANKLSNLRTLCPLCHGIEEQLFWAKHPELQDLSPFPTVVPKATCAKCQREFVPRSGATQVCGSCCNITCEHCGKRHFSRKAAFRSIK